MPLPNATYTLQGQSRPGDPMYSKPKHGMLLRLSTEAVNALQSDPNTKPNVDFVVAEDGSSRIVIGSSSFPLQSQTEEIPHDLYLRSVSAAKPFVPLKFYANVIGRLSISERELDDELASRIHKKTAAAAEQRSISKTKFIDATDLPQPTTKAAAKKKTDLFRKPLRPSDQSKASSFGASNSSAPSPRPSQTPKPTPKPTPDGITSMEKRLIHYLAVAERSSEEAIKAVGGPNCDANTRQNILDAMHSLAEQGPASRGNQQIWRLKNQSWLEVRPYEWPRLSEAERTNLARGARRALKALGIPETDPRWDHAKYRPPANLARTNSPIPAAPSLSTSDSAQSSTPVPKRGISSKEAREKKARKPDQKGEIMMKDETRQRANHIPSPAPGNNSVKPTISTSTPTSTPTARPPIVRRTPGSGYKLPPKPTDLSRSENKSRDGSIATSTSSSSAPSKDVDVIMKEPPQRPSGSHTKQPLRASSSHSSLKKEEGELSTSSSGTGGIGARIDARPAPAPVKRVKHLREEAMDSDRETDKSKDKPKEKIRVKNEDRSRINEKSRERMDVKERDRSKERERERSLERVRPREGESVRRNNDVSTLKRKKVKEEEEDLDEGSLRAAGKRRKTENGIEALSGNRSNRDREQEGNPEKQRDRDKGRDREQERERRREQDRQLEHARERERERSRDRDRERQRQKERDRDRDRESDLESTSKGRDARSHKSSYDDSPDRKPSVISRSSSAKGKATQREPSPPPAKKIKKEAPVAQRHASTASTSSTRSSTKGTKIRRKSPIYTSSEDEDETPFPISTLPTPTPTVSSSSSNTRLSHPTNNNVLNNEHETDHRSALRSKYTSSYLKYLNTFQTLVSQKQEIERLLNRSGSASMSDSDGDVELLDLEGLTKILTQNKQQWEELQSIQLEHERG
ncbi:hypothetical protein FB446DRAFT_842362 [Lentinula raphanica]|nr:hypothetical protein FB446DRAFT_842362 [Lentinula raphanica]